jgi:hypothetical protein
MYSNQFAVVYRLLRIDRKKYFVGLEPSGEGLKHFLEGSSSPQSSSLPISPTYDYLRMSVV